MSHPFIVKYIENFIAAQGKHYIVLEYAKGISLLKHLKICKKFSENEAKVIFKKILEGVEYLHKKNVAHRDLKLDNIIIGKDKSVKLIDFGFATKCKKEEKGRVFCGTPSYMAPEIINHQEHNYLKADIWALGIILYTLLAGKFPFKAQNDKDLYTKIRKGVFTLPEGITLEAKTMLLNMLQADPNFRKSATSLLKDPWFIGYATKMTEESPLPTRQKPSISGTIGKYKKLYSGNRRNLIRDTVKSNEQKKDRIISTSPYNINATPYKNPYDLSSRLRKDNLKIKRKVAYKDKLYQQRMGGYQNNVLEAFKHSSLIKTYFKSENNSSNSDISGDRKVVLDPATFKNSAPAPSFFQGGYLAKEYMKRNSKSNIHLRPETQGSLPYPTGNMQKHPRYSAGVPRISDKEIDNSYLQAFPNNLERRDFKRQTFTMAMRNPSYSPPSEKKLHDFVYSKPQKRMKNNIKTQAQLRGESE